MSVRTPPDELVARLPLGVALAALPIVVALTAATPSPYDSFEAWTWISGLFVALMHSVLVGFFVRRVTSRSRAGMIAVGVVLGWLLPLAMVTLHALQAPPIAPGRPAFCGGTGPNTLLGLSPIYLLALLVGGGCALILRWRGLDRAIGVLAKTIVFVVPIWTLVAWSSSRPPAPAYLAKLPVVAGLVQGQSAQIGPHTLRYQRHEGTEETNSSRCVVDGLEAPYDLFFVTEAICPELRVRYDAAGDLALVDQRNVQEWSPLFAFRPSEGRVRSLDASELGGLTGPPRGFFVVALVGVVLGLGSLLLGRSGRGKLASIPAVDAVHQGDGHCELDGAELLVPAAAALPIGPVTLMDTTRDAHGYRDSAARSFEAAYAGTVAAKKRRDHDLAASFDALALTITLFGVTPIVVASLLGLH